ncbi:response regulator [Aquimarina celericrescens]|uniref:histidine kinase n=1 Tax=Aquimarina celericrescens TaxID=1964542 RepID=A0ABW5ATL8_9FLAO|nr:response regulator [Aquimarina celericrescens]
MRISIAVLFFFVSTFFYSQNSSKIDSLKNVLQESNNEQGKFETLTSIFEYYLYRNLDSAGSYEKYINDFAGRAPEYLINSHSLSAKYHYFRFQLDSALYHTNIILEIAKRKQDDSLISDSYRRIAILESKQGNLKAAEATGKLALKSANNSGKWLLIASANTMLGNQFYKKDNYETAIKYYLIADSIYKANNERSRNVALIYDNISNIYINFNDRKALDYTNESESIYASLGDKEGIAYTHNLRGTYYQAIKQYRKSIKEYLKSVEFYDNYGNDYSKNEVYVKLLNSYSALGEYENAEKYLRKSEKLITKETSADLKFETYLYAIQFYIDQGKNEEALLYLNKTEDLLKDQSGSLYLHTLRGLSEGYAKAFEGLGKYDLALKYSKKWRVLNDSINKLNNLELSKNLETKYQTEKKEKEIVLLEAEKKTIEIQKSNQRNLFLAGIGVFSLAGIFLFLALRNRQKTNKKLKELDTAKSRFFENISHEFRTPLSLINGPIEEQLKKEALTSQEKRNLTIAKNNSSRLLTLVDQILDLSKLESHQYSLKVRQSNLSQFLKAALSSFRYQAETNHQKFIAHIDLDDTMYWFDRDVLEKIINNLVGNALKYTPKHHKISVLAQKTNASLHLEVKNTGTALSKEELTNIFSRFHRAHENKTGTGIGLALTRELIELHKGSITAKSDETSTSFQVTLPIEEKAFSKEEIDVRDISKSNDTETEGEKLDRILNESITDNHKEEGADDPILLIVDDNAELREYLSSLFTDDFTIKTAKDGKEGFEKAIKYVPDVIITDLMMPNEDGLQLTEKSKTHQTTSHIPIMMLTAKAGDADKLEGIEIGADAYVTKPFNTEILKATVHNLLESRKKLQERFSQEVILTPKEISVSSYDEQFLSSLQDVMDANLVESDFSAENFAATLGMSRMQLHRKLKALTGLSTTEFIRSQRLKLAAQLLKKSEINISQVGYAVGFNNHSYFTKCFKEQFGVSPSDFAKS